MKVSYKNMMYKAGYKTGYMLLVGVLLLGLGSCTRKVTRVSPDQQVDLSGRWNDVDSKQVSAAMIEDVIGRPWREAFVQRNERRPVVIVGLVENNTHEHINADVFIKDLERSFINGGLVRLVEGDAFRERLRAERADQQEFASAETQKRWANELGADFMLFGTISSIVDAYRRDKVTFYKINLELANIETGEKVWIGDKEVKKLQRN